MSENRFTPKEAQTFKFQKGDKIPPSEWERDYWETWEEQGYTKSQGGVEKKDGRKENAKSR